MADVFYPLVWSSMTLVLPVCPSPAKQAMFTEPADQSVWWYHHFLLTWAEEGATSCDMGRYENFLRAEAATLEELIEVEGRCKVCLGLAPRQFFLFSCCRSRVLFWIQILPADNSRL